MLRLSLTEAGRSGPAKLGLVLGCVLMWSTPLLAQRGRLLVPLPDLEARAKADSNDPAAHYELGLAYLLERRSNDAERAFRAAISINSQFAPAYLGLSVLPYSRKPSLWRAVSEDKVPDEWLPALDTAWSWGRRAVMLDPLVDLKPLVAVAPPRESMGATKWEVRLYTEFSKGFEFFWDGQYERAYDWFDEIVRYSDWLKSGHPKPEWLLWYHGLAAAHSLNYTTAIADFTELLERATKEEEDPDRVHLLINDANDFRYILGVLHQLAGQRDEAVVLLREVLTHDLGLYAAHTRLAELQEARRNWPEAAKERQRAIEANPDDPGLVFDLGLTYAKMGAWGQAEEPLRRAMQLSPRNARIPFVLGETCARLGRPADARAAWETFLALAPTGWTAARAEVRGKLSSLPASGTGQAPTERTASP